MVQPGEGNRLMGFYPGEEKLIKTKPAVLVCQKLGFFGRESPCGIERQTVCSHAVHAKDPCAGKKCDDVDAYGRHVAVVVGDQLLRERRAGGSD